MRLMVTLCLTGYLFSLWQLLVGFIRWLRHCLATQVGSVGGDYTSDIDWMPDKPQRSETAIGLLLQAGHDQP